MYLTHILPKPKVISLKPGQPAHPCSLTKLYNVGWPTSIFQLDHPKNDN